MDKGTRENLKRVGQLRKKNECIFKGVGCNCESQGDFKSEKNHVISKSHLKRIAKNGRVMVFGWEDQQFYLNGFKLSKRKIKNANLYRVLCGNHDKLLFREIENNNPYNESDIQNFEFALRAFIFQLSHAKIKADSSFKDLVSSTGNKIAQVHMNTYDYELKKIKKLFLNEQWDGIKHEVIRVNKKVKFISCFCEKPFYNIDFPGILLTSGHLMVNIFPDCNDSVILLSYFENAPRSIIKYCKRLKNYSQTDTNKFLRYINKLAISHDPNIAINPDFWENLNQVKKNNFYYCSRLLKASKSLTQTIINTIKLYFCNCKYNFFE